jgi:hypothetical protein
VSPEEPELPPQRIALNRLRVAAANALEHGATRDQITAAVDEAERIIARQELVQRADEHTEVCR